MRPILACLPGVNNRADGSSLSIRELKRKPGKTCVLLYTFDGPDPIRIVGKMYKRDRGPALYARLQPMNDAAGTTLRTPALLGCHPGLGLVFHGFVEGDRLDTVGDDSRFEEAVKQTAGNLAALHSLVLPPEPTRTMQDHLKKYCHPGPDKLALACPEYAPLLDELLTALHAPPAYAPEQSVPSHGDVNLTQVIVREEHAWLLDFDGFCRTDRALDVGNFMVTLRERRPADGDRLATLFLSRYLQNSTIDALPALPAYQALACLRRAMICYRKQLTGTWRTDVGTLLGKARDALNPEERN